MENKGKQFKGNDIKKCIKEDWKDDLGEDREDVVEYIISFEPGELYDEYGGEFITDDKGEADDLFDDLKEEHKLDQVSEYIEKTWEWDKVNEEYYEGDVDVYFYAGDELEVYGENKEVENKEVKTDKYTNKVKKALNYMENEYNELGTDDYEFLYDILTSNGTSKSKVEKALDYIYNEYNELGGDDYNFLTNILDESKAIKETYKSKNKKTESLGDRYEVWQSYYEDGRTTTEYVMSFDNYAEAQRFASGLMQDPDCDAWVEDKEAEESKKVEDRKIIEDLSEGMTEEDIENIKQTIEELKTAKFSEFTEIYRNNNLPSQVENYCDTTLMDDNLNSVDGNGDYVVNEEQMRAELIRTLNWFLPKDKKTEAKQVNNMKIKYNKIYDKYDVITPDGRALEEFDTEEEAIEWAKEQKDFIKKKEEDLSIDEAKEVGFETNILSTLEALAKEYNSNVETYSYGECISIARPEYDIKDIQSSIEGLGFELKESFKDDFGNIYIYVKDDLRLQLVERDSIYKIFHYKDEEVEDDVVEDKIQPDPDTYYKGYLYRVFDKDYNLLTYGYVNLDDAIEYAEDDEDAKYIEKLYYDSIINDNLKEGDIIWEKDDEDLDESKKIEGYSLGDDKESFDVYKHTADFLNKVGKALEDLGWKFNKSTNKFEKEDITIDMEALQDSVDNLYIESNKLKLSTLANANSSYEDIGEDTSIIYYVSTRDDDFNAKQLASKINNCGRLEEGRRIIESKLIVTNIKWDTDGEDIDLPKEMEVELPEYIDETDEDEVDEYISDYISDETGFCHYGFDIKEVKTEAVMTSNKVSVYQIQETANCSYLFMGYDFAVENGGPDMNDYEKVAEVEIDTRDTDVTYVLDEVFTYGNTNIEYYDNNPKARSISVSDILEYNGNKYYVDSFGFKKLEDTESKKVESEEKVDYSKFTPTNKVLSGNKGLSEDKIDEMRWALPDLFKNMTDEQKQIFEELSLREMVMSCLVYGDDIHTAENNVSLGKYRGKPYVAEYYDTLGKDVTEKIIKQQTDYFNRGKVIKDVGTDSEGVTYNSFEEPEEESKKVTEAKYGDSNPDKIVPDAYCEIEKTDKGYYINCGIGTHTSLGGGKFTIYPEDYLSNLHKEVKKLAKERGIKRVYDKVKTIIPEYNAMIPEYNDNIENMIKDLTPFAEKSKQGQLTRADLDSIEEITGKITPNRMSTLPEFEWSGKFGRLRSLIGNLKRYETDLSNPLARADTITITESKEVKTEAVRYVIYKNEEPISPYKNPEGGYTQYSDIDEAIADAKEIDADYIEKLIYKNEDEADREELADTVSVVWKSKKTEATLNKFQTMTTDKDGNEMLLKDVSYNNACSWLEKELAKAGSKVVDTETKGNKTIIKADNKTKFEYDEEKGTLKRLEEAEDMTQVKDAIKTAVEKSDSTDLEKEQVKGSLDVLKTDEESAIEGYEDFKSETEKVADEELADAVNNQMEEIIDDEKEHIEKLDTIKSALGENKKTEAIDPEVVKEKVEKAKADIGLKKAEEMIDTENELTEGIKKEIIQYAKQQGLDVEKLQKQGQLDSVAEALDNIVGEMVSKTAVEYMDTTGKDIEWDFDISNNDIQVIIQ